jgi:fructosamine-3-kinase
MSERGWVPDVEEVFVKHRADAPEGFFAAEAAGLTWLAETTPAGGVRTAPVLDVGTRHITLRRLRPGRADPAAAEDFGRRLAVTHAMGAAGFGTAPTGSPGKGWIGPLPMSVTNADDGADGPSGPTSWGIFFAAERIRPYLRLARDRGAVDRSGATVIDHVCDRLTSGDGDLTGPEEPVARLHGDLWSGNVMWTPDGAVLIDPAAHGGHRESDLAMLALFGAPYLDRVLAAYHETRPLAPGWRRRVRVHQLFPLLVHAALFGSGYGDEAVDVARRYA